MSDLRQVGDSASVGAGSDRRRSGRLGIAAIVAAALSLLAATAAQATTVTVGSVLPTEFTPKPFGLVATQFNTALPEKGASLVSPVTGAVVRWRVQGAKGGPFFLRVLHPNGSGAYQAVGTSGPTTPTGTGIQTFPANLPIKAGDLIGVDPTNTTDEIGIATAAGASYAFANPSIFEGATVPPSGGESGKEVELSAEVQPQPEITAVAPSTGSVVGGTAVTITGTNLNGASAVKFGTKPAATFTVVSETQITATAPAATKVARVDIGVTTLAGISPTVRADGFTYRGCTVPKLKGKTLRAAKSSLRGAGCKPGKVKKVHASAKKTGKVVAQNPAAGKVLAPGSKVTIKLGK
jgi:PASTA domain/IPT/TIG domain